MAIRVRWPARELENQFMPRWLWDSSDNSFAYIFPFRHYKT